MAEVDLGKPVCLIVNPKSGYGGQRTILPELRAEIRHSGLHLIEYTTTGPDDATRYARTLPGNVAAVIVWGGDGTVNEIVNGLAGSDVPIMPCLAGTENLLAKELKIPREPRRIVDVLKTGSIINCDVGRINQRNFLLIIGVGFDGEVVRRVTAHRTGHISHLSYFWPLWRTFWEHDFPHMRISADGQEIFNDYGMAFIGNISRYAVGLRICRDAVLDDGLLDMVVFSCREQAHLLLHAGWTLLRRHPLKGNVIYRQFRSARIETDVPVPSQVDGDVGPNTPLDISVAQARVKLLLPRNQTGWSLWRRKTGIQ